MILIVDDPRHPPADPRGDDTPPRCSLQQTLRRMGFYAARPAPRATAPSRPGARRRPAPSTTSGC